jgi:DNA topoisomerase I
MSAREAAETHLNGAATSHLPAEPGADCVEAARSAGLRYVTDEQPGIRRRRAGAKGFVYLNSTGMRIGDPEELRRIKSLAIPPAWTGVWICPSPRGHLQATGRDARGRKQYRYHPKWREVRDSNKYDRMSAFGRALPLIRTRTDEDLRQPGLSRRKILAAVVQLLEKTLIRVGNEEYTRTNGSFGLTTLRNDHVDISGSTVHFEFRGKGGKRHCVDLNDRRLARVIERCQELPGQELFQYLDGNGERQTIGSADVNGYLKEITGQDFTAKDFRTWAATVLATCALRQLNHFTTKREAARNLNQAVDSVAARLGNTRTICKKSYVHPVVIEAYVAGALSNGHGARSRRVSRGGRLSIEERGVLALLERAVKREAARRGRRSRRAA